MKKKFASTARLVVAVVAAALVAACGGGGGGGGGPPPAGGGAGGGGSGGGGGGGTLHTIGGTVIGLASGASVLLQNNGGDNLTVSANGAFTFATELSSFTAYNVSVATQPANGQVCAITNSSGAGTAVADVGTVRLTCASVFTLAGSGVSGLGNAPGEEAVFFGPSGVARDAAGTIYVADQNDNVVRKITSTGVVSTLAGSGVAGYVEGAGTAARFRLVPVGSLSGIAVDTAGNNIYVADTGNHVIRKITSAGVVTTLAGSGIAGFANGTGAAAQFNEPQGVAVDGAGNVFVADALNHRIRMITPAGVVTTFAGSGAFSFTNGNGTAAAFRSPAGVAIDSSGTVYVADTGNHAIRKITAAADVTTLVGSGSTGYRDSTGTAALFNAPKGIAVDSAGNLYVADSGNSVIRAITEAGVASTLAGSTFGFADGPATLARFSNIAGVAVDGAGNVYVGDWSPRRVRRISPSAYTYTAGGYLVGLANSQAVVLQNNGGNNLTLTANGVFRFSAPLDRAASYNVTIATQPVGQTCTVTNGFGSFTAGNVYSIKINCAAVTTLAGQPTAGYTDATGAAAQFRLASLLTVDSTGIAVDSSGNVYVADTFNNMIRKITPAGVVSTLAGATTAGYVDATGIAARFSGPRGVAVDSAGNVYVGDTGNFRIRRITPAGVVSTFAGSGTPGYNDASGTAAQFFLPRGVALDSSGNLYVADTGNHTIRKITPAGDVTRLAGSNTSPAYANATGAAAGFRDPSGVAVDAAGNVYVADTGNGAIRKITPAGVVTTLAGSPEGFQQSGYVDSTGTGVEFRSPAGVAVDAAGTVYVADWLNHVIRRINTNGTVTTLAGSTNGYLEGNGATARFQLPGAIAVDASGTLYVADDFNNVIRKIAQ